jgi:hypothetical protein
MEEAIGTSGACLVFGESRATVYSRRNPPPRPEGPHRKPAPHPAELSEGEREAVLAVLDSPEFADKWGRGSIPDQYGRDWNGDDGDTPAPPAPDGLTDLPPILPWWGLQPWRTNRTARSSRGRDPLPRPDHVTPRRQFT